MKSRFLFPYAWRKAGYLLLIMFVLISVAPFIFYRYINLTLMLIIDATQIITLIIGLFLVAFSKEAIEDEQIAQLRLDCLQWGIYIHYSIFVIIFFIGLVLNFAKFFSYYIDFNLGSPLLFFIFRFRSKVYLLNRQLKNEGAGA